MNIQDSRLLTNEDVTTSAESDKRAQEFSVMEQLKDRTTFVNLVSIVT